MIKVKHGEPSGMMMLERELEYLAEHASETVTVYDIDYPPLGSAKGLVLISFGDDFSDERVNVTDKVAELGARLVTALNRLKAEQEADEEGSGCSSCPFCFCSDNESVEEQAGDALKEVTRLLEELKKASRQ